MAKAILVPLLVSGYIAMLMTSFCNRLEGWKIPRSLSAFIALLLIILLALGLIFFIVSQLQSFTNDVEMNMEESLNNFAIKINTSIENFIGYDIGMGDGFKIKKVMELIQSGNTNISELLFTTIGTLSNIILLPVFIFFLLIYRDHLAVFVTKVFDKQRNKVLMEHMVSMRKIVHAYIVGAGKVMIILGIVNTAVLFALGIKHAIFLG